MVHQMQKPGVPLGVPAKDAVWTSVVYDKSAVG